MQFSEAWLRTFVDPPIDSEALAHALTMSGLEVEELRRVSADFSGVVVGQVVEVTRHPNADRLNVCSVDIGSAAHLQIVCGAPNVSVGIKVPCAVVGALLPPAAAGDAPFEIKLATMRGVESRGMLCSARELKLSEDHGGLLILDPTAPLGAPLREVLDLNDHCLTLKLTPNKADCLSVHGVAREVAAFSNLPIQVPAMDPVPVTLEDRLPVTVVATDLCGRFSGRIIRNVNAKAATPAWMRQRLERSGQRSISALVDISNYVMLELGRPTHVFDLARIHGGLTVRWGKKGETLKLLNGTTIEVDESVGVIADELAIESLAGIMGGDATAVSLETTDIYLEAAFWWPEAIQGRARRYNFSTDASHRFERGVDGETTVAHIERISRLILDICGGNAGPIDDQKPNMRVIAPVRMRIARAEKVIGVAVGGEQMEEIFRRLNFAVERHADEFIVVAPSYRFDIALEEDLIEEVARSFGFENIPAHLPIARHSMLPSTEAARSLHAVRDVLAGCGYQEMLNFSFVEAQSESDFAGNDAPIKVVNPIANQYAVMRSTLIGSLVENVRYNLNRKTSRIRAFEIAKVYRASPGSASGPVAVAGVAQPLRVGAIAYGAVDEEQWGVAARSVDFYDVKHDLEVLFSPETLRFEKAQHPALHPGRCARVLVGGVEAGWIGELHPRWMQKYELPLAPVVFELDAGVVLARNLPVPKDISKFPVVTRDLAFVLDVGVEVQKALDVIDAVRLASGSEDLIQSVVLFDEYRGKGLKNNDKSLAFRFRLQDTQKTLSDEMIERALADVTEALQVKLGASLRI